MARACERHEAAPSLCDPNAGKQPPWSISRKYRRRQGKGRQGKTDAFMARLEAINTILEDAEPYDLLMVCAQALAHAMPLCCEKHEDEFKTEFLRVLSDCIAEERRRPRRKGSGR